MPKCLKQTVAKNLGLTFLIHERLRVLDKCLQTIDDFGQVDAPFRFICRTYSTGSAHYAPHALLLPCWFILSPCRGPLTRRFTWKPFGCQMNVHDSEKVIGTLYETRVPHPCVF